MGAIGRRCWIADTIKWFNKTGLERLKSPSFFALKTAFWKQSGNLVPFTCRTAGRLYTIYQQRSGVNFRFCTLIPITIHKSNKTKKNNILIVDESQTLLSNDFVHYHLEQDEMFSEISEITWRLLLPLFLNSSKFRVETELVELTLPDCYLNAFTKGPLVRF